MNSTVTGEEPLIFTSMGNIPLSELNPKVNWEFDSAGITFAEEYYYGDTLVKRSAHRFQFPEGTSLDLKQGVVNG